MRIFHSFGDATVADAGLLGAYILRNLGFCVLILRITPHIVDFYNKPGVLHGDTRLRILTHETYKC